GGSRSPRRPRRRRTRTQRARAQPDRRRLSHRRRRAARDRVRRLSHTARGPWVRGTYTVDNGVDNVWSGCDAPAHMAEATTTRRRRAVALDREAIVVAALTLADRDGSAGLTMRRLGAELGVDPTA